LVLSVPRVRRVALVLQAQRAISATRDLRVLSVLRDQLVTRAPWVILVPVALRAVKVILVLEDHRDSRVHQDHREPKV
jgi:hypothetical protein